MYLEVAPQTKSGDTESGTVGALEFGSGHWRCSLVVLQSDCSKSLAAGIFKGVCRLTHPGPPKQTMSSTRIEILWLDIAPLKIGLNRVFIAFVWTTLLSFASSQLSI